MMSSANGHFSAPPSNVTGRPTQTLSSQSMICCLMEGGERCNRPACSYSYSKRIEKTVIQRKLDVAPDPSAKHSNICVIHRRALLPPTATGKAATSTTAGATKRYIRRKAIGSHNNSAVDGRRAGGSLNNYHHTRRREQSDEEEEEEMPSDSDERASRYAADNKTRNALSLLAPNTLKRIKKHLAVQSAKSGSNKQQLTEAVAHHLNNMVDIDAKNVIDMFIYTVKNGANRLDGNTKASTSSRVLPRRLP